ncbi:MAG: HAD family hydrolase [Candidatus Spyradenecus sp.]
MIPPSTSPVTVIWDFNGTLIDDLQACLDALNAILRAHHLSPLSREDYRRRFDFPVAAFYHSLGMAPATPFDWEALSESFHLRYLFSKHLRLQPGARECVGAFREGQMRQGVLSALEQGLLEMQLQQFGLAAEMDFVLGSSNYEGASKAQAAERLALHGPVVLIGDTLHDAEVARAQGWQCLLCAAGHQTPERLARAGYPVVESLREVTVEKVQALCAGMEGV